MEFVLKCCMSRHQSPNGWILWGHLPHMRCKNVEVKPPAVSYIAHVLLVWHQQFVFAIHFSTFTFAGEALKPHVFIALTTYKDHFMRVKVYIAVSFEMCIKTLFGNTLTNYTKSSILTQRLVLLSADLDKMIYHLQSGSRLWIRVMVIYMQEPLWTIQRFMIDYGHVRLRVQNVNAVKPCVQFGVAIIFLQARHSGAAVLTCNAIPMSWIWWCSCVP